MGSRGHHPLPRLRFEAPRRRQDRSRPLLGGLGRGLGRSPATAARRTEGSVIDGALSESAAVELGVLRQFGVDGLLILVIVIEPEMDLGQAQPAMVAGDDIHRRNPAVHRQVGDLLDRDRGPLRVGHHRVHGFWLGPLPPESLPPVERFFAGLSHEADDGKKPPLGQARVLRRGRDQAHGPGRRLAGQTGEAYPRPDMPVTRSTLGQPAALTGLLLGPSSRPTLPLTPDFQPSRLFRTLDLLPQRPPCPVRLTRPPSHFPATSSSFDFSPLDPRTPSRFLVQPALGPLALSLNRVSARPTSASPPPPTRTLIQPFRQFSALIPSAFPNPNFNRHTPPLTVSDLPSRTYGNRQNAILLMFAIFGVSFRPWAGIFEGVDFRVSIYDLTIFRVSVFPCLGVSPSGPGASGLRFAAVPAGSPSATPLAP